MHGEKVNEEHYATGNRDHAPTISEKLVMLEQQAGGLILIRDMVVELVYKVNGPLKVSNSEVLATKKANDVVVESMHERLDDIHNAQSMYINDIQEGLKILMRSL